jgi:hypothetical protein
LGALRRLSDSITSLAENTPIKSSVTERRLRSRLTVMGGNDDPPRHQWLKALARPAAEMRVLSDEIKDLEAHRMMLKLANDYDNLADRAEDRAARDMPGPSPIPKGS